jgi:hypothetical protein
MKQLKNVDLICIDCASPENAVKALIYSSEMIKFGSIKLFSHYKPINITDNIKWIQIEKQTHKSINWFALNKLSDFIDNEFMLSIHSDGFVINPHLWNDEFLNYDYIGAPWPKLEWCRINRVGNGGFVLKSKKFLVLEKYIPYTEEHNDVLVTNKLFNYFIENGCKYAPIDLACKFSIEHFVDESNGSLENCFGFHGKLTDKHLEKIKLLEKYD